MHHIHVHVAVNFFLQLNFILPLFLGMVMYDNELKTKEVNLYLLVTKVMGSCCLVLIKPVP